MPARPPHKQVVRPVPWPYMRLAQRRDDLRAGRRCRGRDRPHLAGCGHQACPRGDVGSPPRARVISHLTDVSAAGSGHAAPVFRRSSRAMKNVTGGVSRMRSVFRGGSRGGSGRKSSAYRVVMCEALWSRSGYIAVDVSHMTGQVAPFGPVVGATGRIPVANGAGMLTAESRDGHGRYMPPIECRIARLDL
jgi:hypothetical protein